MIKTSSKTKIYIFCTPNYATGGPECLHQLYFKLKQKNRNVFMFYYPLDYLGNPVHENYKIYSPEFVTDIEDDPENILIVPETRTYYLPMFNNIQKVIWWLSVDFYVKSISNLRSKLSRFLGLNKYFAVKSSKSKKEISLHLAQSKYAEEFLKSYNIRNVISLSDYSNYKVINFSKKIDKSRKENIVLYNPKKGMEFTEKIISAAPNIKFQAIINMDYGEVLELISRSKVYIDFGYHPGKDRLPRECGILDCCIITNMRGSAFYHEDVTIPDEYKFIDSEDNINSIISQINICIENYESEINNFIDYKQRVLELENVMESDIENIFEIN